MSARTNLVDFQELGCGRSEQAHFRVSMRSTSISEKGETEKQNEGARLISEKKRTQMNHRQWASGAVRMMRRTVICMLRVSIFRTREPVGRVDGKMAICSSAGRTWKDREW